MPSLTYPVVIGGMGGSGTRVIAEILKESGVFLGDYTNDMLDNYYFNFFITGSMEDELEKESSKELNRRFMLLEKAMTNRIPYSQKLSSLPLMIRISIEQIRTHWRVRGFWRRSKWSFNCVRKMLTANRSIKKWGWKSPHTFLYIKHLNQNFPEMRFIQSIRDGFDMAYTKNLHHFGYLKSLGMTKPTDPNTLPSINFEAWYRLNKKTIETGKHILKDRFLAIKFEDLCFNPESTIIQILDFLDLKNDPRKLVPLVTIPKTIGRHKEHIRDFTDEQYTKKREIEAAIREL